MNQTIQPRLVAENAAKMDMEKIAADEKTFRWLLDEDAMAAKNWPKASGGC